MSDQSAAGNLALSGTLLALSTLVVGLRFYARYKQKVRIEADDVFVLLAWITYIGAVACHILLIDKKILGYTSTTPEITTSKVSSLLQISWDLTGTAALACIKFSAVFFYRRIFCVGSSQAWFHIATTATLALIGCWLLVFEVLPALQCGAHFAALWDGTYKQHCTLSNAYIQAVAVTDFLLDLLVLLLPVPRILQLHAPAPKKMSIIAIFMTALVALAASAARMVIFVTAENGGIDYFLQHDAERVETAVIFYAMLSMGLSLVAINLPSILILFATVTPEKLIRSIRSAISLASARSGSGSGKDGGGGDDDNGSLGKGSGGGGSGEHAFRADLEACEREVTATRAKAGAHELGAAEAGGGGDVRVLNTTCVEHHSRG